jgi:CheY-like chemotaxis protein
MTEKIHSNPLLSLLDSIRNTADQVAAAWHRFWFEPLDPLMLGFMRWLLFYNLLTWSLQLDTFFGHHGVQPLEAVKRVYESRFVFSFWFWLDDQYLWPAHIVCLVTAGMFCIGAATRLTSILAFLITISYSQRVPVANFGFDQILGMMCLYLAMAPSGAAVSADNFIRKWWRRRRGVALNGVPVRYASARMASRLIQLHLCAIYFWAGFSKLKGPTWWTGEAMWNVIANQEYQTLDLTWMAWMPWLPFLIAHITIAWETSFIVLVWNRRLRPFVLAMGTAMHFGIGAFLGMWTFGLIMTFAYLSFAEPEIWRSRLARIRIRFAPGTPTAPRTATACIRSEAGDLSARVPFAALKVNDRRSEIRSNTAVTAMTVETPLVPQQVHSVPLPTPIGSVLVIATDGQHRTALREHFRGHGLDCRAVDNGERAMHLLNRQKFPAVVVHGSGYFGTDPLTLVCDLIDYGNMPLLILLTPSQMSLMTHFDSMPNVACCMLPATLREIRSALETLIARCGNSSAE